MSRLLSPTDVQERCSVSRRSAYRIIRRCRHVKIPGGLRVYEDSLERYAQGQMDAPGWHYVYFIRCTATGNIKIGRTKDMEKRLRDLQNSSGSAVELLGATYQRKWPELKLHERFAEHRLHGEWFSPAPELLEFIETEATRLRPPERG